MAFNTGKTAALQSTNLHTVRKIILMDKADLTRITERTGIAAESIIRWHFQEGPLYISRNPGRPKGKIKRPAGTLSLGEAKAKFGLNTETLKHWREQGLPFQKIGTLVAMKEKDLKEWVRKAK